MSGITVATHEFWAHHEFMTTRGVIDGSHLELSGGNHSEVYLNADRVFPDPARMARFYQHWKGHFFDGKGAERPEVIAGPATGGVYLVGGFSQFLFAAGMQVHPVWADKQGKELILERSSFDVVVAGKRVLVVEDVITSGTSTMKTIGAVRAAGGEVIGVACMVNRRASVTAQTLDVPELKACWQLDVVDHPADDCPFCAEDRPMVTNIGHGDRFQERNPDYEGGFTTLDLDPRIPFGEVRTVRYQDGARNLKEVRGKIINPDRRAHPEAEILLEITAPDGDHRGGYLPLSRWQISKISPE